MAAMDPNSTSNSVSTANLTNNADPSTGAANPLYPGGIPDPSGTMPAEEQKADTGENTDPTTGSGTEGETDVWISRYSKRNFIGRIFVRGMVTAGWLFLATYRWHYDYANLAFVTWLSLIIVVGLWLQLIVRVVQSHYSHYYRMTNRRLFVSTGILHRQRDMMELLRVKDVFTRQQSLLERWLGLGTVVVVPTEKNLPTFYVAGVNEPKKVMDLIWHHARAERDQRSVKVDSV